FCFYFYFDLLYLHSFPTRRSSDLLFFCLAALPSCRFLRAEILGFDGLKMSVCDMITAQDFLGRICPCHRCCKEIFFYECSESERDRKSTRLNSSHVSISYAVFCLK